MIMIPFAQVHKSSRLNMKHKEAERPVFQVILKHGRDVKLQRIAEYKGCDKSSLIRNWIDATYNRLPESAK